MLGQWARARASAQRITAAAVLVVASAIGCGEAEWSRQDLLACASPDGTTVAVFFREFCCGAAGSQDEHVIVRRAGSSDEHVAFGMGHGYDVVLEWTGEDALAIHYPADANRYNWRSRFSIDVGKPANTVHVTLLAKPSQSGLFIHDTMGCTGGGRVVPVSDAIRRIERHTR